MIIKEKDKLENVYNFLININYNGSIKLLGIADSYRGQIILDTNNKKIMFFGNNTMFHEYFINEKYKKIVIKNENKEIVKEIIINGDQSMLDIVKKYDLQNGIDYKQNYIIEIFSLEPGRTRYYYQKFLVINLNSTKNLIFKINNNILIEKYE